MPADFAGTTAAYYARYRRDVPSPTVAAALDWFGVGSRAVVIDLGAGAGQLTFPLAARTAGVWAVDPEPAMLHQLRLRADRDGVRTVVPVLGADSDLPALRTLLGDGRVDLVTVANALHWMDADAVFAEARRLTPPGGGIGVITSGQPVWQLDRPWSRALRDYLSGGWVPTLGPDDCGTGAAAVADRAQRLTAAGFEVAVLRQDYALPVTADWIAGHIRTAIGDAQVPAAREAEFTAGIRAALAQFGELVEPVAATVLVGRHD